MATVRASRRSRTSLVIRFALDVTRCIFGGYFNDLIETVDYKNRTSQQYSLLG